MRFCANSPLVKRFGRSARVFVEALEIRRFLAAPTVAATSFEFETGHSFAVAFSANVGASVSNADLVVYNLTDRTTVPTS